jgi:hypothetical protein
MKSRLEKPPQRVAGPPPSPISMRKPVSQMPPARHTAGSKVIAELSNGRGLTIGELREAYERELERLRLRRQAEGTGGEEEEAELMDVYSQVSKATLSEQWIASADQSEFGDEPRLCLHQIRLDHPQGTRNLFELGVHSQIPRNGYLEHLLIDIPQSQTEKMLRSKRSREDEQPRGSRFRWEVFRTATTHVLRSGVEWYLKNYMGIEKSVTLSTLTLPAPSLLEVPVSISGGGSEIEINANLSEIRIPGTLGLPEIAPAVVAASRHLGTISTPVMEVATIAAGASAAVAGCPDQTVKYLMQITIPIVLETIYRWYEKRKKSDERIFTDWERLAADHRELETRHKQLQEIHKSLVVRRRAEGELRDRIEQYRAKMEALLEEHRKEALHLFTQKISESLGLHYQAQINFIIGQTLLPQETAQAITMQRQRLAYLEDKVEHQTQLLRTMGEERDRLQLEANQLRNVVERMDFEQEEPVGLFETMEILVTDSDEESQPNVEEEHSDEETSDEEPELSSQEETAVDAFQETARLLLEKADQGRLARNVQRYGTRQNRRSTAMGPSQMAELITRVDIRIGQSKAKRTWQGYSSVMKGFIKFDSEQTLESYKQMQIADKIIHFLEWKMSDLPLRSSIQRITVQSAYVYTKKLTYLYKRSPFLRPEGLHLLESFRRSLERMGAKNPDDPSRALDPAEMSTLLHHASLAIDNAKKAEERQKRLATWAQLTLQWLTASRTEDMLKLEPTHIKVCRGEQEALIQLTWPRGTKCAYSTTTDRLSISDQRLIQFLEKSTLGRVRPFALSVGSLNAMLKSLFQQPEGKITSHSIRKGALTWLLRQEFPVELISEKAKHRSVRMLRAYIDPAVLAEMRRALEMSASLLEAISQPQP